MLPLNFQSGISCSGRGVGVDVRRGVCKASFTALSAALTAAAGVIGGCKASFTALSAAAGPSGITLWPTNTHAFSFCSSPL